MSTPLKVELRSVGRLSVWRERLEVGETAGVAEATWEGIGGWARQVRLLPDGCADIVWDGERLSLFLPQAIAVRRPVTTKVHNVGLRLRCGFTGLLLGRPPPRSAPDPILPLSSFWGRLATDGEARLGRQGDPDLCREILLDLVGRRLADVRRPETPPLDVIHALGSEVERVESMARRLGWSDRDLRRTFARHVGLSPKRLQMIFRFRRLMAELPKLSPGSRAGAHLAAALDYADQAHMIRDCRAITGTTPGQLIRSFAR